MKSTLLAVLESRGINVENDILQEVFRYVEVDSDIDNYDLEKELSMNRLDYSGAVSEGIDGTVDVYYSELDKWAGKCDSSHYVQEALDEGLSDGKDHYKNLMAGQYLQIQEEVYEALAEIVKEVENLD